MNTDQQLWLEEYAVTCRVFKGRWSIRHCVRMYHDMQDLKIQMSTRARGKVTRHQSDYNPCRHCKVLAKYIKSHENPAECYTPAADQTYSDAWVA